jgi:hypothetical protein
LGLQRFSASVLASAFSSGCRLVVTISSSRPKITSNQIYVPIEEQLVPYIELNILAAPLILRKKTLEKLEAPVFKQKKPVILLFMLLLVFYLSFIDCAEAQQEFVATIENPVNREIIIDNNVNLQFFVAGNHFWPTLLAYKVYFDGNLHVENQRTINNSWTRLIEEKLPLSLSNATQGQHTIRVDVNLDYIVVATGLAVIHGHSETSSSVAFYVYRGIQPQLSITGSNVESDQTAFKIETNEPASTISYSLDGKANVTVPQNQSATFQDTYTYNVTLSSLSPGPHTLTVYTKDVFNNTAMTEKAFTVEQPPSLLTIAAIAVVVLACAAALLLIRRSRKKVLLKG